MSLGKAHREHPALVLLLIHRIVRTFRTLEAFSASAVDMTLKSLGLTAGVGGDLFICIQNQTAFLPNKGDDR